MAVRNRYDAFAAAESIGYNYVISHGRRENLGTVYEANKDGRQQSLKISAHTKKVSSPRYLVQLWVSALTKVDRFILWFEDEPWFHDVPAARLAAIFEDYPFVRTVRHKRWQVNLDIETGSFEIGGGNSWDFLAYREPNPSS